MSISSVRIDRAASGKIPLWRRATGERTRRRASSRRCWWSAASRWSWSGHLARLARSLAAVYGAELPAATSSEQCVRPAPPAVELGRLRLTALPSRETAPSYDLRRWDRPGDHVPVRRRALRRSIVAAGHGPHKWVDRRGMDHPDAGPGQLIVDGEELWRRAGQTSSPSATSPLWTPPLDGRILAGIARAAVLELAARRGPGDARAANLRRRAAQRRRGLPHQLRPRHRTRDLPRRHTAAGHAAPSAVASPPHSRQRWDLQAPRAAASRPESRSALSLKRRNRSRSTGRRLLDARMMHPPRP